MKLYLLYGNDEDGPVNLVATLDKTLLPRMAEAQNVGRWFDGYPNLVADLANRVESEIEPGEYPLMNGWGGLVLHVVTLVEA